MRKINPLALIKKLADEEFSQFFKDKFSGDFRGYLKARQSLKKEPPCFTPVNNWCQRFILNLEQSIKDELMHRFPEIVKDNEANRFFDIDRVLATEDEVKLFIAEQSDINALQVKVVDNGYSIKIRFMR